MFDDPGDIDRNGIPDAIQADPVIVPPEPAPFSLVPPEPGLPGITAPIDGEPQPADAPPTIEPGDSAHVSDVTKAFGDALERAARGE